MAEHLDAFIEITFTMLVEKPGVKFDKSGWKEFTHIFNRTVRIYLDKNPDDWNDTSGFKPYVLNPVRKIRALVMPNERVDKKILRTTAIDVMKKVTKAIERREQQGKPVMISGRKLRTGEICTDYINDPDRPFQP